MSVNPDDPAALLHMWPRPLPKRLGRVYRSKLAYQQETRERAAALKRERYAANREAERAKARARYRADPSQLERKLRCNMTCQQRVRAARLETARYARHRAARITLATEGALARRRAKALLRAVLDVLDGRPARFHPKQTFG